MRSLALALVISLALAPTVQAKQCRDAKGHFTACPTSGYNVASSGAAGAKAGGHPDCKKGKPCGGSCIAVDKTCHK